MLVVHEQGAARLMDLMVGDLALSDLRICALLDTAGVHFAEDARHGLGEVCRRRGIGPELGSRVDSLFSEKPRSRRIATLPWALDAMCADVVWNHHAPLRSALDRLRASLASQVTGSTGAAALSLQQAWLRIEQLAVTLLSHFAKEKNWHG
jgi:hypothetical protein